MSLTKTSNMEDGGPVFPRLKETAHKGITLRDLFAVIALKEITAREPLKYLYLHRDSRATEAWAIADSMIRNRGS